MLINAIVTSRTEQFSFQSFVLLDVKRPLAYLHFL